MFQSLPGNSQPSQAHHQVLQIFRARDSMCFLFFFWGTRWRLASKVSRKENKQLSQEQPRKPVTTLISRIWCRCDTLRECIIVPPHHIEPEPSPQPNLSHNQIRNHNQPPTGHQPPKPCEPEPRATCHVPPRGARVIERAPRPGAAALAAAPRGAAASASGHEKRGAPRAARGAPAVALKGTPGGRNGQKGSLKLIHKTHPDCLIRRTHALF